MDIRKLLSPERLIANLAATNKQDALKKLSATAALLIPHPADVLLRALLSRESLGSTGIGAGIALPHARIAVDEPFVLLACLRKPIPFDAIDEIPVDRLALVLSPPEHDGSHLRVMSCVARKLRDPLVAGRLRRAHTQEDMYDALA